MGGPFGVVLFCSVGERGEDFVTDGGPGMLVPCFEVLCNVSFAAVFGIHSI